MANLTALLHSNASYLLFYKAIPFQDKDDQDYTLPEHLQQNKPKKYFMDPLPNLSTSMARFNTSYKQAAVSTTCVMSDFGMKQVATKKKVRSQFRINANKHIEKLAEVSVKGNFMIKSKNSI